MKKHQHSVRLSADARTALGRTIVRLTLNPAIFALSHRYVDWTARARRPGTRSASELILEASRRFPALPLSWAVEGYIALLSGGDTAALAPFAVQPDKRLSKELRRFARLSPAEKIRLGERWKRELERLREAA
ncbi:MAG: hypothetical protein AB1515_10480 [Nitrospirota bacterium]